MPAVNSIIIRHDCYFSVYQDKGHNLLRANPLDRIRSLSDDVDDVDYDSAFADVPDSISSRTRQHTTTTSDSTESPTGVPSVADDNISPTVVPISLAHSGAPPPTPPPGGFAPPATGGLATPATGGSTFEGDLEDQPYPYWLPSSSLAQVFINATRMKPLIKCMPSLSTIRDYFLPPE